MNLQPLTVSYFSLPSRLCLPPSLSPSPVSRRHMLAYPTSIPSPPHLATLNMNASGFFTLEFAPASLGSPPVNNGSAINPTAGSGAQKLFSAAARTFVPSPSATSNGLTATGAPSTPDRIVSAQEAPSPRLPAPAPLAQASASHARPSEMSGSPLTGTIGSEPAPGRNFEAQSLGPGNAETVPHGSAANGSVTTSGTTSRGVPI